MSYTFANSSKPSPRARLAPTQGPCVASKPHARRRSMHPGAPGRADRPRSRTKANRQRRRSRSLPIVPGSPARRRKTLETKLEQAHVRDNAATLLVPALVGTCGTPDVASGARSAGAEDSAPHLTGRALIPTACAHLRSATATPPQPAQSAARPAPRPALRRPRRQTVWLRSGAALAGCPPPNGAADTGGPP